ncbi:MAG: 4-alpha-glucanotransferase, partial [Verrucomicrobia bacterium]|nr:4-alpha-glucanotransferase [Verrucomicrobiota bacterium]
MRIVFRVNFRTDPGQSLWLKHATVLGSGAARLEQVLPMRWLNGSQWEIGVDLAGSGALRVEYSYQLRQDGNGVELDEWDGPRVVEVDFAKHDVVLRRDTWCSAGTVDHAFETKGFDAILPARGPFAAAVVPKGANHGFCLRMAAVPEGMVPCVLGGVREMGDWDRAKAVPMKELAANRWEANLYLPNDWRIEYKYGLWDVKSGRAVSLEEGENRSLEPRSLAQSQWTVVSDEGYRRDEAGLYRGAGVAIPVFSLRSENGLGVGEFADLKPLADWAKQTGLKLIQILPINDTTSSHDWTDSYPYSAISVYALHPMYLRLDDLGHSMPADFSKELSAERVRLNALAQVDYEAVMAVKTRLLKRVFAKHAKAITASVGFKDFFSENRHWVLPYAVFCVKRDHYGTADFSQWGEWS